MNDQRIQITGGAGAFEAAAVVAVVHHVLDSERRVAERRAAENRPSAWMASARPLQPGEVPAHAVPDHRGDPL